MTPDLPGLRFKVIQSGPRPGNMFGDQVVLQFGNGYGASIIRGPYTYGGSAGLFEVAVLEFDIESDEWHLTYDTPVTDDVIGHLDESGVVRVVTEIHDLPPLHKALTR